MSFLKRLIPIHAKASISLDKPTLVEGEAVAGKVNVDAQEYVQSTGVRIEARVYEHYQQQEWVLENNQRVPRMVDKKDTLYSRDEPISGPSDFGQGPTRVFPFTVGIPAFKAAHVGGSIEYNVKGVVAVKGRPDITGETNIAFNPPATVTVMAGPPMQAGYGPPLAPVPQGYGTPGFAPPPAQSYGPPAYVQYTQAPPQPKVQVRCSYCQALIDQGSAFCPHCGGHQ